MDWLSSRNTAGTTLTLHGMACLSSWYSRSLEGLKPAFLGGHPVQATRWWGTRLRPAVFMSGAECSTRRTRGMPAPHGPPHPKNTSALLKTGAPIPDADDVRGERPSIGIHCRNFRLKDIGLERSERVRSSGQYHLGISLIIAICIYRSIYIYSKENAFSFLAFFCHD
jgi:hypothetical protein